MNAPAPYIHWGFILISLPNFVLICVMVLLFVLALVVPFPHHRSKEPRDE
jgi:large-conductance mechanosensitive channel